MVSYMSEAPITGTCHCGAVSFNAVPNGRFLVECNCSICRKLGAIWLHGPPADLTIDAPEGATITYSWGEKGIAFHSCATCGCTTHWSSNTGNGRAAVNIRLANPVVMAAMPLRHFDGADSWTFLD